MQIEVNRMQHGTCEKWYFGRSGGINNIEKTWGDELPTIFWFKSKTEEAVVICHNQGYGVSPYKLIRFKYKERRTKR